MPAGRHRVPTQEIRALPHPAHSRSGVPGAPLHGATRSVDGFRRAASTVRALDAQRRVAAPSGVRRTPHARYTSADTGVVTQVARSSRRRSPCCRGMRRPSSAIVEPGRQSPLGVVTPPRLFGTDKAGLDCVHPDAVIPGQRSVYTLPVVNPGTIAAPGEGADDGFASRQITSRAGAGRDRRGAPPRPGRPCV